MLTTESALRKDKSTTTVLQHRHFAFIARVIAGMDHSIRGDVAKAFGEACAGTNANFDRVRFYRACGVVSRI